VVKTAMPLSTEHAVRLVLHSTVDTVVVTVRGPALRAAWWLEHELCGEGDSPCWSGSRHDGSLDAGWGC